MLDGALGERNDSMKGQCSDFAEDLMCCTTFVPVVLLN